MPPDILTMPQTDGAMNIDQLGVQTRINDDPIVGRSLNAVEGDIWDCE